MLNRPLLVGEPTFDTHTHILSRFLPGRRKAFLGDTVILVPVGLLQLILPRIAGCPVPWPRIQIEQQSLAWGYWFFICWKSYAP